MEVDKILLLIIVVSVISFAILMSVFEHPNDHKKVSLTPLIIQTPDIERST